MSGTGHIHHIEVVMVDQTVEVNIYKIQIGRRGPVSKQTREYSRNFAKWDRDPPERQTTHRYRSSDPPSSASPARPLN